MRDYDAESGQPRVCFFAHSGKERLGAHSRARFHTAAAVDTMSAIEQFSTWIARHETEHTDLAIGRVRSALLDTIGCMLAGIHQPPARIARTSVAAWGSGAALVVGTELRLAAPWAAFANATAAHALDFDDWDLPANAHPSAVLVPALFANAEQDGHSPSDVVDAYLIGLEVILRLGEAVNMAHYERGWHSTATLGVLGAAAACARMQRLCEAEVGAALGLATSMASGFTCQFGTMAKAMHAGFAAKGGVLAARLAANGATASPQALDGERGFVSLLAGDDAGGFEIPLSKLGNPPAIEEHGLAIKRYASCGYTHRVIDAVLSLRDEHGIVPEEVQGVDVSIPRGFANILPYGVPTDEREAMFSAPYCVAAGLFGGDLGLDDFTPAAVSREPVLRLAAQVRVRPFVETRPDMNMGSQDPDTVTIALRGGQTVEASVGVPLGAPARPLCDAALRSKFLACAQRSVSHDSAERIVEVVGRFETLTALQELTGLLEQGAT